MVVAASLATVLLVLATVSTALSAGMAPAGRIGRPILPALALALAGIGAAVLVGFGLSLTLDQRIALVLAGASPGLAGAAALGALCGANLVTLASVQRAMALLAPLALGCIALSLGAIDGVLWLIVAWALPFSLAPMLAARFSSARRIAGVVASAATAVVIIVLIVIGLSMDDMFWSGAASGIAGILIFSALLIAFGAMLGRGLGDTATLPMAASLRDVTPAILAAAMSGHGGAAVWLAITALLIWLLPVGFALIMRRGR